MGHLFTDFSHTSTVRQQAPKKPENVITQHLVKAQDLFPKIFYMINICMDSKCLQTNPQEEDIPLTQEVCETYVSFSTDSLHRPLLGMNCWAKQRSGPSSSQSRAQIIFSCTLGSRAVLASACTTCIVTLAQESWIKVIPLLKRCVQGSGMQLHLLAAEAMAR